MNYAHPYSRAAHIPRAIYAESTKEQRKNERRVSHLQMFVVEAQATISSAQCSPFFVLRSFGGRRECVCVPLRLVLTLGLAAFLVGADLCTSVVLHAAVIFSFDPKFALSLSLSSIIYTRVYIAGKHLSTATLCLALTCAAPRLDSFGKNCFSCCLPHSLRCDISAPFFSKRNQTQTIRFVRMKPLQASVAIGNAERTETPKRGPRGRQDLGAGEKEHGTPSTVLSNLFSSFE